ncbi:MAG: NAD(P)-dependent dehydrogenase (short-subunit alcohol dehydrogenase family) [Parasphingorhabdus sp.]|jgi:NAD(P)-dependent dehydrogenase (short-subunit alcohol dehydrogenase family)
MINLINKTAVVTGGGQGIGLGISQALLSAGAKVAVVQRSPIPAELETNPNACWIQADLAESDSFDKVAAELGKLFDCLHVLVNNAGVMFEKTLDDMNLQDWQSMLAINLTAPVFLSKKLLPLMREAGAASIIHIGSIEGIAANPEHVAYCSSKAAVHGLARAMAVDLGKDNIRVNAIAPGWIRSALSDDYINAQDNAQQAWQDLFALHPAGRIGEPGDVGNLAAFLASENAAFVTGQVFVIDGGRTSKLPLPF